MWTGVAFALYVEHHAFFHACRDVYLYYFLALDNTAASTGLALVLDDGAFAMAGGALALCSHHAKHRPHGARHDAAAVTGGAGLWLGSVLGACAVALLARYVLLDLEALGHAAGDILQRQLHFQTKVGSAVHALAALPAASAKTASTKATMPAEDVTEHGEYVVHVHAASAEAASAEATGAIEAELVVLLPLLWVVQHFVGLCCFLELLLCCLIAGVTVGVVLDRELAVSLFYLIF